MTSELKDFLTTRAADTDPPPLDLTTITAAGTRRLRRRRFTAYTGTAVLTAGAVVAGLGIAAHTTDRADPDPAAPVALPFAEPLPTYAKRNVIHYGDQTFTVPKGELINQLVRTDGGIVYTLMTKGDGGLDGKPAPDGSDKKRGLVTLLDRNGSRVIGGSIHRFMARIASDDRSSLVSWGESDAERPGKAGPTVVYDTAARREILRVGFWAPVPGVQGSPKVNGVLAIDGQKVYFGMERGLYEVDLATMRGREVLFGGVPIYNRNAQGMVLDVSEGSFLYKVKDRLYTGPDLELANGRPLDGDTSTQTAALSPGSKYVVSTFQSTFDNDLQLHSVATGRSLTLKGPTYEYRRFGQWLDNESFVVAAARDEYKPVDLLRCSARTLECTVIAKSFARSFFLDRSDNPEQVVLPVGYRID